MKNGKNSELPIRLLGLELLDDYLNDVRLYLPYFNAYTVENVVKELQNSEGEDIPTFVDSESLEEVVYVPWTIHTTQHRKENAPIPGQIGRIYA